MKRKALLIGYPGKMGDQHYTKGVFKDITGFEDFLQSPIGGLWDKKTEIETFLQPQKKNLHLSLSKLEHENIDYSLIVFSGHGKFSAITKSTILKINDTEEIDSNILRLSNLKQTVILDCCKEISTETAKALTLISALSKYSQIANPEKCRINYNANIARCGNISIIMHSCAIGEYSYDDGYSGAYYLQGLLESAKEWIDNNTLFADERQLQEVKVLSVAQAHDLAVLNVVERSKNSQNPYIEKPKGGNYPPFCVFA